LRVQPELVGHRARSARPGAGTLPLGERVLLHGALLPDRRPVHARLGRPQGDRPLRARPPPAARHPAAVRLLRDAAAARLVRAPAQPAHGLGAVPGVLRPLLAGRRTTPGRLAGPTLAGRTFRSSLVPRAPAPLRPSLRTLAQAPPTP